MLVNIIFIYYRNKYNYMQNLIFSFVFHNIGHYHNRALYLTHKKAAHNLKLHKYYTPKVM